MKNLWILILCFGIIKFSKAATITSTSGGGNWSSNATWVGNTIPTSSDDVVINGPVNAPSGSTTVNSLVVNSGGILRNLPSYSSTLQVNQNVINHGAIVNNTSGFLNLNIQGNIENNGLIRINRLNLEGTGKVNLTQGNNGHFGNMTIYIYTNDTLHLKSDSKFDTITWYGSGVIDAGNYHLTFHSTTIRDQKISGNGIFSMDHSTLYNTELKGNAEIRGDFFASVGLSLRGNLIIKGTIKNENAYSRTLLLYDSIINEGIVTNNNSGVLYVDVHGHLAQNGTFSPYGTYFKSGGLHYISSDVGKYFEGRYYASATDSIEIKSDIWFKKANYFGSNTSSVQGIFKTNGYVTKFDSCTVDYSHFRGNDSIDFNGSLLSYFSVEGNYSLSGNYFIGHNCNYHGHISQYGVVKNQNGYNRTLGVYGKLTNYGEISSHTSGVFDLDIHGDIHQAGVYRPYRTYFKSGGEHALSMDADKFYEGLYYATVNDSIKIDSDIWFKKANYYGSNTSSVQSVFRTNGHVAKFDSCTVDYSHFRGNDSINFNGSTLTRTTISGNYKLSGDYIIGFSVQYNGIIDQYGSIKNQNGYSRTLGVYGKLTNFGEISSHTSGVLDLDIHGDIHQAGVYKPYRTYFKSGGEHALSMDTDKFYEGLYYATVNDSIKIDSDIWFKKANYYGSNTSSVQSVFRTNGHVAKFDSCIVRYSLFRGNDSIDFNGSTLSFFSVEGNYSLSGNYFIGGHCNYHGTTTQYGSIKNQNGYSYNLKVGGELNNHGSISNNNSGSLDIFINGNLHQNGIYKPRRTYFEGLDTSFLSQSEGKMIEGDVYITKDSSQVIQLLSSIHFKKVNLYGSSSLSPYPVLFGNGHQIKLDSSRVNRINLSNTDTIFNNNSEYLHLSVFGKPKLTGLLRVDTDVKFFDTVQNYGKIVQLPGYGMILHVNGVLENYDFIGSIGSGSLNINLRGSLMNAGEYAPRRTTFIDSNTHHLSALGRTPFGGEWYSDNHNGPVLALSDLVFKNAYINLSTSKNTILNANGYQLIFDSTRVYGTAVLNSDSLWFVNQTSVYNVDFLTTANIYGTMNLDNNVRFLDTLNNHGEIQNVLWYGRTLDVFGVLNNHAEIRSNPSSGSLTIRSYNDVFSNGLFNINSLEFNGASPRTVFVNDYGYATTRYWIRDTLSLVGDNTIPGILQPLNANARLWIASNTQLIAPELNFSNQSQIANQGRILTDKTINNATTSRYNCANAQIYNYRNSDVQKQLVESYGHQTHPSTPNAADMWWRLRPTPFDAKDSLRELVLYYDESLLKNSNEEKLKVYFSENAGLNWQNWTKGVHIDTSKNTITIANAPNYGHYILSDTSLGIIEYKPQLDRAEPRVFGNKGKVTIYGFGLGLTPEMTVSIQMEGAAVIPADTSYLTDGKGESFLAVFNVESIPNGKYDLMISMPGENEMTLKEYFRVEKADRPDPWSMLTGRNLYMVNRWQTYNIAFGNKANVDAEMVPLFFVVKDVPGMEVAFPDVQIAVQNAFVDLGWTEWQDTTVDLFYTSDSLSGFEGQMMRIYPFIIPNISAYSAQSIRVRIKVPTVEDLEMAAWITDPLTEGLPMQLKKGMNPDVAACLAGVALKYGWDKAIGLIPGKDCFKLAYKIGEAGYNYVRKDPNEPSKPWTFYSLTDAFWGWGWSVLDCAGKLTPVGYKYQLAKELVNTTFEMKNLYDADRECREKFKGKKKSKHRSRGAFSFDPNEIVGPSGYNDGQYISDGSHMVYTVYFENKDSATAAAMDVIVRDTLDKMLFDFETFSFQDVTIADSTYEIQGFAKEFRILVDLAPRIHTLVQITGGLDTATGEVLVTFYSIDRSTLEEQEDINFGFLPPNKVSPQGEGNFVYSVGLKPNLPHQTEIPNQANIFFDFNKPIITNRFVNHIDTRPPNSYVIGLPAIVNDSVFTVNWTGNDDGAGIEYYTIYVSENDSDYYSWVSGGINESAVFNGNNKYKYKFYSVATDSLGLGEEHPTVAQTSTEVDHLGVIKKLGQGDVDVSFYPNPARDMVTVDIKRGGNGHLTIYNMHGQVIKEMPVGIGSNAINIADLPRQSYLFKTAIDGIYVMQVVVLQ